jgi:hypothetical protein
MTIDEKSSPTLRCVISGVKSKGKRWQCSEDRSIVFFGTEVELGLDGVDAIGTEHACRYKAFGGCVLAIVD